MGKPTGFMDFERNTAAEIPCVERIKNWDEFHPVLSDDDAKTQAARCMNCGIPFCHGGVTWQGVSSGCSIGNLIPEWNDLVYSGQIQEAYERLESTNPLHEVTSRVCPALCEGSCTVGLNDKPVAIREIERYLSDKGWENGWLKPHPPESYNGKTVAVIGSGPAGLTTAWKLNQDGYQVTVFEKSEAAGGLMMFGIPNMKMPKDLMQRRIQLFEQEGITFVLNTDVGKDIPISDLDKFDAIVLAGGAGQPRDLTVQGRNLPGVSFAVPFLANATRRVVSGDTQDRPMVGHKVIVIGGGDTGNDCVATAIRMGAESVEQLEIMPALPDERAETNPWPRWPFTLKTDYGQKEAIFLFGRDPRSFLTTTVSIQGNEKGVTGIETVQVEWIMDNGRRIPKPIESSWRFLPATDVLLALGFVGAETYLPEALKVSPTRAAYTTENPKVFAAGDMRTGQSLIVRAMDDGMKCAEAVEKYLNDK